MIIDERVSYGFMCPYLTTPDRYYECLGSRCMAWCWITSGTPYRVDSTCDKIGYCTRCHVNLPDDHDFINRVKFVPPGGNDAVHV